MVIFVVVTIVVVVVADHDRGFVAGGVLMAIFVPLAKTVASRDEDQGKHHD